VPVNVVDRPAYCDFSFGAIVNRSPLVIGISTDGAAPVFGQAVRAKIEALIPKGFARWAEAPRAWRPRVAALALSFRGRRSLWDKFTDRAIASPDALATDADLTALLTPTDTAEAGSVILVGAGPGDPELLTLRAVRALQSADVILFDHLVSAEILDFARREVRKMLVGKAGYAPSCNQDDVNALMVSLDCQYAGKDAARAGCQSPRRRARSGYAHRRGRPCHECRQTYDRGQHRRSSGVTCRPGYAGPHRRADRTRVRGLRRERVGRRATT
jgi:uroporphyrin-III C-methyltransferase / precorrin-2 dehydrogenase / sirohydrochlorin ferrochelatase